MVARRREGAREMGDDNIIGIIFMNIKLYCVANTP